MKTSLTILRAFRALKIKPVTPCYVKTGTFQANSQYGYPFGFCDTRKEALRYVLNYYSARMNLITQ